MIAVHSSAKIMLRARLKQTLIQPGVYVAAAAMLAMVLVVSQSFVRAVDSASFHFANDPLMEVVVGTLIELLGVSFVNYLFSQGPFLFSIHLVAFLFILGIGAITSSTFAYEMRSGFVDLIRVAPVARFHLSISAVLRSVIITGIAILGVLLLLVLIALVSNIFLGPLHVAAAVILLLFSVPVYSYAVLIGGIGLGPWVSMATFVGVMAVLVVSTVADSLIVADGALHPVFGLASTVIRWISPFHWFQLVWSAIQRGAFGISVIAIVGLVALAPLLLWIHGRTSERWGL